MGRTPEIAAQNADRAREIVGKLSKNELITGIESIEAANVDQFIIYTSTAVQYVGILVDSLKQPEEHPHITEFKPTAVKQIEDVSNWLVPAMEEGLKRTVENDFTRPMFSEKETIIKLSQLLKYFLEAYKSIKSQNSISILDELRNEIENINLGFIDRAHMQREIRNQMINKWESSDNIKQNESDPSVKYKHRELVVSFPNINDSPPHYRYQNYNYKDEPIKWQSEKLSHLN